MASAQKRRRGKGKDALRRSTGEGVVKLLGCSKQVEMIHSNIPTKKKIKLLYNRLNAPQMEKMSIALRKVEVRSYRLFGCSVGSSW